MPATDTVASGNAVATAAERLLRAAATRTPCPPVRDLLGDDVDAAYAVQGAIVADALASGRRASGWKVGLTSEAVQRQLGVDQPDFGRLFADMEVENGGSVPPGLLLQPRIEAEIAFVMQAAVDGPVTEEAVREAIGYAIAAFEIVDSRIAGWDIRLVDTVADNASCGLYMLGHERVPLADIDLPEVAMSMTAGASVVSSGYGRDCLGDPLRAATWVAQTAAALGAPLRASDVVLAGALGPMVGVEPGRTYTASLSGLGELTVTFDDGAGGP
jgi:2-keto-4-pentenoate hydratase